ncbi:MAG: hypothetical protein SPJ65_01175 [Roseburia sp.]|nr:hypothetical protein [Roseburia sp.]
MTEFEIHIPARKKPTIAEKDATVKVTGEAYNALTEIYNESTLSMRQIASLLIIEGSKHIVYDKAEV